MRRLTRGFSLTEVMLSMAVTLMIMAMVIPIFEASNRGFSSSETHDKLKEANQSIVNSISHNLVQCKRIFENTPNDKAIFDCTGVGLLPGSVLPLKVENGTLSPKTFAERAQVGNTLFIARFDAPIDMLVTSNTPLTLPNSFPEPVRLDAYKFNLYYLKTLDAELKVGDKQALNLLEWESIPYVDYGQIKAIQNFTKSTTTVAAPYAMGHRYAWLSTAALATDSFYNLYSTGTTSRAAPHMILMEDQRSMIKIMGEVTGSRKYGVSPNTIGLDVPNPVPVYATAAGGFPGGFEVQVVGNAMSRQVHTRLVLVSSGYKGKIFSREESSMTSAGDLW